MIAAATSLWPDDIKVDVLSPLTILRYQAAELRKLTKGRLEADVVTTTGQEDFVVHRLEIVARQLGDRRYGVLTVTHRAAFYPVVLEADCFRPKETRTLAHVLGEHVAAVTAMSSALNAEINPPWPPKDDWRPAANDQDEFLKRVAEVLRSPAVRATIDSLLALSNEKNQPADTETAA